MKLKRTYFYARTGAILAALTSSSSAQLTWAPTDDFNIWDPSPTILAWEDAANLASPWDNTGLQQAIFNLDEALTIVPIADAGVIVGDLQYSPAVPDSDLLSLSAVTDNLGAITITPGGATWSTGGGEIEFTNNVVLDNPDTPDVDEGNGLNDTRMIMTAGDTLTVVGGGTFDTGERPGGATWLVNGATLDITEPAALRGNPASVGQFETVRLVDESVNIHERNASGVYANNWELPAGVVRFGNRFSRQSILNGVISGDATIQIISYGGSFFRPNNPDNTFTGGFIVDSSLNRSELQVGLGDGVLGAVPASFDPSNITLLNNGELKLLNSSIDSNRGITLDGGGIIVLSGSPSVYGGSITGMGGLQIGRAQGADANGLILTRDAHDYTGDTTIFRGRLILGVDEALPDDTILTIGGGGSSLFVLNGFTQTLTGLTTAANNTRQVVNFDANTSPGVPTQAGTVILDIADQADIEEEFLFGSAFGVNEANDTGNLNVVKNGDGAINLGNLRIAGTVDVNTGALRIGNSIGISAVGAVSNNATLVIDEATTAASIRTGAGSETTFNWEVSNFTGTAEGIAADPDNGVVGEAPGFTQLAVAGDLAIDAGSTFTITVDDILTDGALANFTETDTSFVVATVGGANNITLSQITVDSSEFTSGTGTFTARLDGSNIVLDYIAGAVTDAYATFAAQFPNLVGGFGDDDDLDGLANGAEFFFFGSDPTVASNLPAPLCVVSSTGNGNLVFSHDRPLDFTGVTVTYEWSTTLEGDFTPSGVANGGTTVTITPGATTPSIAGYETVEVTTSSAPATLERVFVRVSLSQP